MNIKREKTAIELDGRAVVNVITLYSITILDGIGSDDEARKYADEIVPERTLDDVVRVIDIKGNVFYV
jgi:hypothetical protein